MSVPRNEIHMYPFINDDDTLQLNTDVLHEIERANNPHLIIFSGKTRIGKSTTLNNLIFGCIDGKVFVPKMSIFKSSSSHISVTHGCDIYGPIKLSELKRRNKCNSGNDFDDDEDSEENDADIFIIDTEGFGSMNQNSKMMYPGILTLMQVCTSSVMLTSSVPTVEDLTNILLMRQLSKFMQSIVHFELPKTILYATSCNLPITKYKATLELYNQHSLGVLDNIRQSITANKIDFDASNELKIIAGGLYKNEKDVDQKDVCLNIYWASLQKIINAIDIDVETRGTQNGHRIVELINILFRFLKRFHNPPSLKESDFNGQLKQVFTEIFIEDIDEAIEKIKVTIKRDFSKCIKVGSSKKAAKAVIIESLDKGRIEVLSQAINTEQIIDAKANEIKDLASKKITDNMNEFCATFTSNEVIKEMSRDIVQQIRSKQFREHVDTTLFDDRHINDICIKKIHEKPENHEIIEFIEENAKQTLDMTISTMKLKIKDICNEEHNKLPQWDDIMKDKFDGIKQDIISFYNREIGKCTYEEDVDTMITKPETYAATKSDLIIQRYFSSYDLNAKNRRIIKDQILEECIKQYNSMLMRNKLPPKPSPKKTEPSKVDDSKPKEEDKKSFLGERIDKLWENGGKKVAGDIIDGIGAKVLSSFTDKKESTDKGKSEETNKGRTEENKGNPEENKAPKPQPEQKAVTPQIVLDVIKGNWGNNPERSKKLTEAGYNPNEVQNRINEYYSVATNVIRGEYGNGEERKTKLREKGYDPTIIQQVVNIIK